MLKPDGSKGMTGQKMTNDNIPDNERSLRENVIDACRAVFDPEIPVNIYDLGLIYDIVIDEAGHVDVKMTLTSPFCPVAEHMPGWVHDALTGVPGVASGSVTVVWDPPWGLDRMSEEARLELGLL